MKNIKERIAFWLYPKTVERMDQWLQPENCKSRSELVEKAVNFYVDYLSANKTRTLLPVAVSSAIEGRLGMFEDRMSSLLFKQTVELSMIMNILAWYTGVNEAELQNLRGKCIADIKRTNGRLTFSDVLKQRKTM